MVFEEAMEKIREKGGKRTRIREAIVSFFVSRKDLVTAAGLLENLRARKTRADRTTVYRELAALKKMGVVREVSFAGKPSLFELAGDHHHHLVCVECDSVRPVTVSDHLEGQEKEISRKEGFSVINHSLEFYGICKKCR